MEAVMRAYELNEERANVPIRYDIAVALLTHKFAYVWMEGDGFVIIRRYKT